MNNLSNSVLFSDDESDNESNDESDDNKYESVYESSQTLVNNYDSSQIHHNKSVISLSKDSDQHPYYDSKIHHNKSVMSFSVFIDGSKRTENIPIPRSINNVDVTSEGFHPLKKNPSNYEKFLPAKRTDSFSSQSSDKILSCSPMDNTGIDPLTKRLSNIYPKSSLKWIDSSYIIKCQSCSNIFGLINRKHHCRACGGVFCGKCCNKNIRIPTDFIQKPQEDEGIKQLIINTTKWMIIGNLSLVCNECNDKINNLNKIHYVIRICEFLDLQSLYNLLDSKLRIYIKSNQLNCFFNSKECHNAVIHQLSKFREIQYTPPSKLFTKWELNMLLMSKNYFSGHNNWILNLIKGVIQKYYNINNQNTSIIDDTISIIEKEKTTHTCQNFLLCSRKCSIPLDMLDCIEIIKFISIIEHETEKTLIWSDVHIQKLINFMIEKSINKSLFLKSQELQEKFTKSTIPLICSVFSELMNIERRKINYIYLSNICDKIIDKQYISHFILEIEYIGKCDYKTVGNINFVDFMRTYIGNNYLPNVIKMRKALDIIYNNNLVKCSEFNTHLPILYPLDLNYNIVKILKREKIKSNTSPIYIEVEIEKNNIRKIAKFIIKKDYILRKERIVSCLMSLLQFKLLQQAKRGKIEMFDIIPTFDIVMVSNDIGIIEFVENSITLRKINSERRMTLQNYILEKNKNEQIVNVKHRYTQSLAISCCLSYLLGLGDRHLDNIMINDGGQIFHIDFGYLMENPVTSILGSPNIKVTSDMIDVLGGIDGEHYDYFKNYVIKVYDIMRLFKSIILNYYEIIGQERYIDWNKFKGKLENRFMNGMKCKDVEITLINEIETSNSLSSKINDLCHNYKQSFDMFGLF